MDYEGELRKVSLGRTMMQVFLLQQLAKKGMSQDEVMSVSAKTKPKASVIIELHLSEGINK